jgi:hypothetical protein
VVGADTVTVAEDGQVVIDVLANDRDPEGDLDASTLVVADQGRLGTATASAGRVAYRPRPDANGADSFTYRVCDEGDRCSSGSVSVEVTPVNDLPVLATTQATVNEDDLLDAPLAVADVDGHSVTCRVSRAPAVGAATVPGDCSRVVFQPPANFNGTAELVITLSDGLEEAAGTVALVVTPVNDAPVAAPDSASTDWITPIEVAVTRNDSDVDGDDLTLEIVTGPAAGTADAGGGSITYEPAFGVDGSFAITYRACDPDGACDTSTLTVTVAAITVAVDDSVSTPVNRQVTVNVHANDTPGSGSWSRSGFTLVSQPGDGTVRITAVGRFRYRPVRFFEGTDSFVYQTCDTAGSCDIATVTITVG